MLRAALCALGVACASAGFARTTCDVPRIHPQNTTIRLRILRGGLQLGGPAEIPTALVLCNDATLIIGAEPRYSFFYGGMVTTRSPDH